jgi:hypothetical protein
MRLTSIAFAILVAFVGPSFAEGPTPLTAKEQDDVQIKVNFLLDKRVYRDAERVYEVKNLSSQLGSFQKFQFYEKYKTSGWWSLLNPVLGLGSWIQGDYWNAAMISASILVGSAVSSLGSKTAGYTTLPNGQQRANTVVTNEGLFYSGSVLALGGEIYGLVVPWFFENSENGKLKDALSIEGSLP